MPDRLNLASPAGLVKSPSLVTTHISENSISRFGLELYPVSVKIVRPSFAESDKRGIRAAISSFTWGSKKRLRFQAANALPALISVFAMTYHEKLPEGREVKEHLHNFLIQVKNEYPDVKYLWILEFQKRGFPHIHCFFTKAYSVEFHIFCAELWNRVSGEGKSWEHRKVHFHPKQFIPWEMRSAGYLTKYLDKEHQKRVPEGFKNVGRFWGSSRGLVPEPEKISERDLYRRFSGVDSKAPKKILRALCKSQEKKMKSKSWKNYARRTTKNYTLIQGRSALDQLIEYWEKEAPF